MGIIKTVFSGAIINWNEIWWGICKSIMQIIDWIGQAFDFIIGAKTVTEVDGVKTVNNIFESLFSNPSMKL